ncbi:MAG: hypothetical protein NTY48_00765 [Candidatus Diapherotrites archaeon]|nr:hypothetical protein [Candidatus Diapherotrites archaeon]
MKLSNTAIFAFIFLFFINYAHAVAVIVPVAYVATLSIIAFISNILISIVVYSAAKGAIGTTTKNFSSKFALILEIIGKATVLIISTSIAVFFINPITLQDAIATGGAGAAITLIVLLLGAYKKLSIITKKEKKALFTDTITFCLFVFISCSLVAYFSVEAAAIRTPKDYETLLESRTNQNSANSQDSLMNIFKSNSMSTVSKDTVNKISTSYEQASIAESSPREDVQNSPVPAQGSIPIVAQDTTQNNIPLIFQPQNSNPCIISSESKTITITPQFNCFVIENGARKRVFCPVIIDSSNFLGASKIESTGSCSEKYDLTK